MNRTRQQKNTLINVEVFIGGAPLLELRLVEGLLKFGESHPHWRFSLRGGDERYTEKRLREQQVDGALVLINEYPVAEVLDAAGVPWVHLLPGKETDHAAVGVDDRAIGRMGADLLLSKGLRRFAFLGVGTAWSRLRGEGFRERVEKAGFSCEMMDVSFDNSSWTLDPGTEGKLREWISGVKRVTAVMAAHDALANRLVDTCQQAGCRVPEDLAVLGVGDHELLCRLSRVPISSINTNVPEVAVRGALLLEAMLTGRECVPRVSVPPVEVVERRSSELPDFESELVNRVVAHIRTHACEGLKVEDLPKIFSVSRRTLTRRFAQYVGHAPGVEIRQTRLRQAQILLRRGELSLKEIATACGYADLSHFDRSFRSAVGQSPGAYRRSLDTSF